MNFNQLNIPSCQFDNSKYLQNVRVGDKIDKNKLRAVWEKDVIWKPKTKGGTIEISVSFVNPEDLGGLQVPSSTSPYYKVYEEYYQTAKAWIELVIKTRLEPYANIKFTFLNTFDRTSKNYGDVRISLGVVYILVPDNKNHIMTFQFGNAVGANTALGMGKSDA